MYKIKIRNIHAYNNAIKKNEDKLNNAKKSMKVQCPNCGLKYSFYAFEDKDRKLCKHCGIFVYKNDDAKKKYEELEKKRKQDEFERELKKWKKIAEEKERDANRTKGRNVGRKKSTKNSTKTK